MDPAETRRRLEELATFVPTPDVRCEVDAALNSKWEDVQVLAGRVLATWGGRTSIESLRRWLLAALPKDSGWAVRKQAVKCLCKCYEPSDIPWLLDLYFDAEDHLLRHEFLLLITALPEGAVANRIEVELRNSSASRREAAMIARTRLESWKQFTNREGAV